MAAKWTDYVAGDVLTAAQLNSTVDNFQDMAIFNETQAAGTNGGTATSGSYAKRTLNTTVVNNITGCSISSSVITLPAGTFFVNASAPAFVVSAHQIRLQNTTAGTTIRYGSNEYTITSTFVSTRSNIIATFTLSTSSTIELQHRVATTRTTDGLGTSTLFSNDEVYSSIQIVRIA